MSELRYLPYTCPTESWDPDELGNHRAVIEVGSLDTDVVGVRIPWRRRDPSPETKGVLIYSAAGAKVENFLFPELANSYGDLLFQPVDGPGNYYLYFMPYTGTVKKPYPQADYLPSGIQKNDWSTRHSDADLNDVSRAEVVALESADEFNMFTEMELIADESELTAMCAPYQDDSFLVFPEYRELPIRMVDRIPYRWATKGPGISLSQKVSRGEYYVFQLGLYAHRHELSDVRVIFSDLGSHSGTTSVSATAMTCFNAGGIGWDGVPFTSQIAVETGRVQPLWCGIDIPNDIEPGTYSTNVTVCVGGAEKTCDLSLEIIDDLIPRHGDDEPWRMSRLRWLNSTIGTEDEVVPPFTPMREENATVSILGRSVTIAESGLPARVTSYFADDVKTLVDEPLEIIGQPVSFAVIAGNGEEVPVVPRSFGFTERSTSRISWKAAMSADSLVFEIAADMDFDGTIEYTVAVTAEKDTEVDDISLEISFNNGAAAFMTGLGRKGGYAPDKFDWKWEVEHNQDAVWIGSVNGGMQITLKDDHYSRPLNTNFYLRKPLVMPKSWSNDGKGTVSTKRKDDGYHLSCSGGSRRLTQGEILRFDFRLFVSPFKPVDTEGQFSSRYFHAYRPIEEILATGANTINIHHATKINPYINYPFLTPDIMREYIDGAHEEECRVKLYYTVREVTTHAPELFALKSLGDEIVVDGKGGGHAWLQEHLGERYIAAWYALAVRDTSVINGTLSRWHNFYVEGMNWLAEHVGIDGVYIDDLGFGRDIMKRVKRVLFRHRPNPLIDLHSANQYNERDGYASSTNLYLEHFPYIDRLWFGEYFDYDEKPDYWLVEVSGIPFGLMSEMLQDGGNPWRGMVFGMTGRLPRVEYNIPLWKAWDTYGLPQARMIGFWTASCPVTTGNPDIPVTVYHGTDTIIVVLASWAERDEQVELRLDLEALGLAEGGYKMTIPEIEGFQDAEESTAEVSVEPGKGKFIVIERDS